jgi:hypothetical protein
MRVYKTKGLKEKNSQNKRRKKMGEFKVRKIGFIVGILVMLLILAMPTPAGLSVIGKKVLAVSALMIIFWMTEAISKTYSNYGLFGFERMNSGSSMTRSQVFNSYRVAGNDIVRVFSNGGIPDAGCGFDEVTAGFSSATLRSTAKVFHLDLMSPAVINNSMAANNINYYTTGTDPYSSVLINPSQY